MTDPRGFARYLLATGILAGGFLIAACVAIAVGHAGLSRIAIIASAFLAAAIGAPVVLARMERGNAAVIVAAFAAMSIGPAAAIVAPAFRSASALAPMIGMLVGFAFGDRHVRGRLLAVGVALDATGLVVATVNREPLDRVGSVLDLVIWLAGLFVIMLLLRARTRFLSQMLGKTDTSLDERVAARTAELSASEAMFRTIADAQVFGVMSISPAGGYDYMNRAVQDYLGYAPSEMRPSFAGGWDDIMHPDDLPRVRELYVKLLADGKPFGIEYRLRKKGDPQYRWFAGRAAPVANPDGSLAKVIATIYDIDEVKRAQEASQAAVKAKAAFLATMSHEIRTPMNAILGMASMLDGTPLTTEQRDYLDVIRAGGDHLLAIINDILDYSKLDSGRLALEAAVFDIETLVCEAIDLVAGAAVAKGLELAYELRFEAPRYVRADATRIRQVLVNFLANAVKFTDAGRVHVTVSEDGGRLQFAVADTGRGIADAERATLFQPFVQVGPATQPRDGTGLGLAISRRIVEQMGGTTWVESELGKGSTFHAAVRVERTEAPATAPLALHLPRETVWILDARETTRRILAERCRRWAREVRQTARVADAAIWAADGARCDLLIAGEGIDASELRAARTIALPRGYVKYPQLAAAIAATVPAAVAPAVAAPTATTAIRILVAEDNAVNVKVITALLARAGYTFDVVCDGAAAIAAVARTDYDVILMDVQMPILDGIAATRQILADRPPPAPRPHIVALSAGATSEERASCIAAGMDEFLSKPIDRAALAEVLARVAVAVN